MLPKLLTHTLPLLLLALAVATAIAAYAQRLVARWSGKAEGLLGRVAWPRGRAVLIVFLVSLLACVTLSLVLGIPDPAVHDEFSYLLAADTFSHFRLTNPPHPMWVHLDTFQVLQRPTYASKYPPGQGMAMAVGEILTGLPIVGVWLSTALLCAALCWMLMAWMPARWALLGGLLAALNMTILEWSQNYWGGAVAALGGALVLGAARRLADRPRARHALVLGLGLGILANSRPYEGFVFGTASVLALLVWFLLRRVPARIWLRNVAGPLALVLALFGAWMAYYNWRVTGDPLLMPFSLYERQYTASPQFVWQAPKAEPVYYQPVIRQFFTSTARRLYASEHNFQGYLTAAPGKFLAPLGFFRPLALVFVPLLTLPWMLRRDRWMRAALILGLLTAFALTLTKAIFFHYAAPMTCLIFLFLAQGLRYLRLWRPWNRPVGALAMWGTIALFMASFANWCVAYGHLNRNGFWSQRRHIIDLLKDKGGQHLVVVRYRPDHNLSQEWVYNAADIDDSPIVWARDMGQVRNRELILYFDRRQIWLLDADDKHPHLLPYPPGWFLPVTKSPVDRAP
ncbi:MAG TPA: hypothetical protein VFA07_12890 [Chthonomonadaceae bacterium]|nr:hypothetical protein [Chthonomonadaceae bacterium]